MYATTRPTRTTTTRQRSTNVSYITVLVHIYM